MLLCGILFSSTVAIEFLYVRNHLSTTSAWLYQEYLRNTENKAAFVNFLHIGILFI